MKDYATIESALKLGCRMAQERIDQILKFHDQAETEGKPGYIQFTRAQKEHDDFCRALIALVCIGSEQRV